MQKFYIRRSHLPRLMTVLLLVGLCLVFSHSASAAPVAQSEAVYIVQPMDTLNSIALRFGVSPEEIQSANGIADPNSLKIDQRLVIPGLEGITGLLTSKILPLGTSLTDISRQYHLNPAALIQLNRITSPSETIAGIKFLVAVNEEETILPPLTFLNPDESTLEAAIRSGLSPWTVLDANQLTASWEAIPSETLYGFSDTEPDIQLTGNIRELTVDPLPFVQGETTLMSLTVTEGVTLSGFFNGETLDFVTEDGEQYFSFLGIHALADTGPFPLQITATDPQGNKTTFEQLVLLAPGDYGNEWVFVPDDYLDEAVISTEDAYLEPILSQITPERYWDDPFQYPIDEPCINSLFGQRRDYNNGGLFFYHTGLDFKVCASNLNIYAPAPGRVVLAEELTIKGNAVFIDHGWGVFTAYAHLSEINVAVGDFVETGDLLGLIGNTGRSAGPHLHFEVIVSGNPVNPQTWLSQEFP